MGEAVGGGEFDVASAFLPAPPSVGTELAGRYCLCCGILESWGRIPGKNLAWLSFLFIKTSHKRNDEGLGSIFGCLFQLQVLNYFNLIN